MQDSGHQTPDSSQAPDNGRSLDHGWEVPLRCTHCGADDVPEFRGWTPNAAIHFGHRGTIYAQLYCPGCQHALTAEAEAKLAELFAPIPTPPANRLVLGVLIGYWVLLGLVLVLAELLFPAHRATTAKLAAAFFFLSGPVAVWSRWRLRKLQTQCPCGRPRNRFMGMLGRTYCLRCSSCGRLLRLRD